MRYSNRGFSCAGSFWMMIWYTQYYVYCILCLHTIRPYLVQYTINRVHDMRNFRFLNIFLTFVQAKNWTNNIDYLLKVWMAICFPFTNDETHVVLTLNASNRLWLCRHFTSVKFRYIYEYRKKQQQKFRYLIPVFSRIDSLTCFCCDVIVKEWNELCSARWTTMIHISVNDSQALKTFLAR